MTFPRRSLLLATWICWSGFLCLSQSRANGFRWDWRKSEELAEGDTISQSKALSAKERSGLINAVASQLRHPGSDLNIESEQNLQQVAEQTRIKAVDLSGKGFGEFVAQGIGAQSCSPTGNCSLWVLRQSGDKYSVILYRGAAQTFTIQPTVTNGLHDIVVGMHGSATEQGLKLYRFNGSKYHPWLAMMRTGKF